MVGNWVVVGGSVAGSVGSRIGSRVFVGAAAAGGADVSVESTRIAEGCGWMPAWVMASAGANTVGAARVQAELIVPKKIIANINVFVFIRGIIQEDEYSDVYFWGGKRRAKKGVV